jgi:2-oxoisovalerate dehydrogenase E1 component
VVVCSLGDASVTEGEVSEAFQFAVLKKLPIIYLVQDNGWGISVRSNESRAMDAYEYAAGFKGMDRIRIDGSDFLTSYEAMEKVIDGVRNGGNPCLVQATTPLLGHHTSGVRRETYRSGEDMAIHQADDPLPKLKRRLLALGIDENLLHEIQNDATSSVARQFREAVAAPEPDPSTVEAHVFAPTPPARKKY